MKKYKNISEFLIFIISMVLYALTAAPSLMFTDSGELAAACASLNVAHPTGYPLFTLLGHLWTLVNPLSSDIAWLNLLAGVYTALSAVFFHKWLYIFIDYGTKQEKGKSAILLSEKNKLIVTTVSALIYAFSLTVWQQAVAIEVYSLQLLIMNLVLFCFVKGLVSENKLQMKYFLLAALCLGLGFANHGTTLLLIPAMFLFYFKRPHSAFNFNKTQFKYLLLLCLPVILGGALYLYLPIRSSMSPDINWGEVHRSFAKFKYHVSGEQYRVMMFTGSEAFINNAKLFFTLIPYQLGFVGILTALIGLVYVFKQSASKAWFLILLLLACMFYAFNYDIHDIDSYFLLGFIVLITLSAFGMVWLLGKYPKIAPIFFVIPLISVLVNYAECDESDNYTVDAYARMLLENVEENGIIISSQWDYWVSAFWYLQTVEKVRPDVVLVEQELVRRTWYRNQLAHQYPDFFNDIAPYYDSFMEQLELFESTHAQDNFQIQKRYETLFNMIIEKNIDRRPIYMTIEILQKERSIAANYSKKPVGMAIKIERDDIYVASKQTPELSAQFNQSLQGRKGHLYEGISGLYQNNINMLQRYQAQLANTQNKN